MSIFDNASSSMHAVSTPAGYGKAYGGMGILDNPQSILRLVHQDHGLPEYKKRSLSEILNSPEAFDHVMSGMAGVMIARAAAHYAEISKPARTLLSLAGFGIGNILYNTINQRKFTDYNPNTGTATIKM